MPIDIEEFESAAFETASTSDRILRFLAANDTQAFTRQELAAAIDVAPETVGTTLTRLKQRGLVRHREPYWALTDDRDALAAVGSQLEQQNEDDTEGRSYPFSDIDDGQSTAAGPAESGLSGCHTDALREFTSRATAKFDTAIVAMYVFGSLARGAQSESSDIDIFVVVSNEADYRRVDDGLLEMAFDVQLEYDVIIDVHLEQEAEFTARKQRGEPFVQSVVAEGVQIG